MDPNDIVCTPGCWMAADGSESGSGTAGASLRTIGRHAALFNVMDDGGELSECHVGKPGYLVFGADTNRIFKTPYAWTTREEAFRHDGKPPPGMHSVH